MHQVLKGKQLPMGWVGGLEGGDNALFLSANSSDPSLAFLLRSCYNLIFGLSKQQAVHRMLTIT